MKRSAALALIDGDGSARRVLLVHPGGPFFAKKDAGAWSLPKGELEAGEDELTAAKREFSEETGAPAPAGPYVALGEASLKSGKRVVAFAARGTFDVATLKSNEVEIEHHGRRIRFPEVDRAVWASRDEAKRLVNPGQVPLIEAAFQASP